MRRDNISTCGGITSVLRDNISTVEGIQYCGRIPSVLWGITAVHLGDPFSTVEVVQYSGGKARYCGGYSVH